MEQIQKATLTLKTHGLPLGVMNHIGSTNVDRSEMTWNNINLRLLLGDMYDRYDNFNLQLVNIGCDDDRTPDSSGGYINLAGEDNSDRIVTINLSGLNMLNNTYDINTNHIGSSAFLTTYQFYKSFSNEYHNSIVTFTKGNDVCNLTISYKDIYSDTSPASLNAYPHMIFSFNIYGIPRIDHKNKYM